MQAIYLSQTVGRGLCSDTSDHKPSQQRQGTANRKQLKKLLHVSCHHFKSINILQTGHVSESLCPSHEDRQQQCLTCFRVPFYQLPHMPHISECLMKRSLKPTDLRDMTLGQLQVIVNDLHSQIESEFQTQTQEKPLNYLSWIAEMSKRAIGEKHAHAYWPLPFPVDVKVLFYMLVRSKYFTS